jgi:Glycosyl transferases group 1
MDGGDTITATGDKHPKKTMKVTGNRHGARWIGSKSSEGSTKSVSAWIVSFGPVGSGSDGYLIRAEANARALASLGLHVDILEISTRTSQGTVWPNVEVHSAAATLVRDPRVSGHNTFSNLIRAQFALLIGLFRNWSRLRSAEVVVVHGGLLAFAFAPRLVSRSAPRTIIFDPVTVMSRLHRHGAGACTLKCRLRRLAWRLAENLCVRCADVTVAFGAEDAAHLGRGHVERVPHAVLDDRPPSNAVEDRHLVGFLGGGWVGPNRDAVEFIASSILSYPRLRSVRCRVIGTTGGYRENIHPRMEFIGFSDNLAESLGPVSVCCAPMEDTGGPSTKVLDFLTNGKRTVCSAESARGISVPPSGLWVAERSEFAESVANALEAQWSPSKARALHDWMVAHHGFNTLRQAWARVLTVGGLDDLAHGDPTARSSR